MKTYSFPKSNRLTLKKDIEALFRQGKSFHSGPLRVLYQVSIHGPKGIRVLMTVPRKRFRNATDRNRIRRLIREAYRLNHRQFISDEMAPVTGVNIAFIYTGDNCDITYNTMAVFVTECLKKLASEIADQSIVY